ncbi:MAG: 30S ribosome-binding factor RbfA [Opitutales bacterium]|jgi:ribosome-binding factor A|nr:30S ribosome-binding factor RbfA [Opitutales bacterium]MDG2254018.1 30S ribosome-binding factor RbfA [Opitutaceae bacterium]MBT5169636.1 30S ribosome-binding factor RbfA [Opitutales bacterium]MBT5816310.1 30S ribosome-binding factor RbfA [Opitutales bacterium]MBT6379996.1 30S ribosome-binding factor RbfA [Opitutales bacterium]
MSNRNIRVSELVKREVSDILHTRYQGESVSITVTGVDVAPDHSNAKVYYSTIVKGAEQVKAQRFLNRFAGKIRYEMGKRIVLKRLPALSFQFDDAIEQGTRINEIIDSFDEAEDKAED